jgi:hypothetical protein
VVPAAAVPAHAISPSASSFNSAPSPIAGEGGNGQVGIAQPLGQVSESDHLGALQLRHLVRGIAKIIQGLLRILTQLLRAFGLKRCFDDSHEILHRLAALRPGMIAGVGPEVRRANRLTEAPPKGLGMCRDGGVTVFRLKMTVDTADHIAFGLTPRS